MRDMTKRFGVYWFLPIGLLLQQKFESLEKMKSIKMPVLVITGTEDIQIPVEMGERLYAAAPEFKQLVIIPGGGHDNHMSEPYNNSPDNFLDGFTRLSGLTVPGSRYFFKVSSTPDFDNKILFKVESGFEAQNLLKFCPEYCLEPSLIKSHPNYSTLCNYGTIAA